MPDPVTIEPPQSVEPTTAAPESASQTDIAPQVPKLMKLLFDSVDEQPAEEKPKEEPKPTKAEEPKPAKATEPATPKADGAPKGEAAPEPSIKLRKPKVTRPELPIEAPKAPAPTPKPVEESIDPAWESTLPEEQKEILADARDAEKHFPDKHKGLTARTASFLKADAAQRARPDFDDQSPEYRAFLEKSAPKLSRQEIRQLEESRILATTERKFEGRLAEMKHKIFVQQTEPVIEAAARDTFAKLSRETLPDEVAEAVKKEGFEKAKERYGLELEVATEVLTVVTDDLKEFSRLSTRDPETGKYLASEAGDKADPRYDQHQRLGLMLGNICENFKNGATAEQQQRNGKWFVTRDEWNSIRPDQRHRFWTFDNKEIAQIAQGAVKGILAAKIQEKRQQFSRYGYERPAPKQAAPTPPAPSVPPVPTSTPRTPTPSAQPAGDIAMEGIDSRVKSLAARLAQTG